MMTGVGVLFRREFKSYLLSPIAAIVAIAYLLLAGALFMSQFFLVRTLDLRAFFDLQPFLLAVILPAVSMRLWAEDRQLNTLELLLSLPLKPAALVLGKYLAALACFALMLGGTWTLPAMLSGLGQPDLGPVVTGYLGIFLLGAMYLALGQFVSGLCREQLVAFVISLVACQGLYLIGTDFIAAAMDGWWPGFGGFLQQHLGVVRHVAALQKGVVDGRDLAYFLLLTGVFLALNGVWMEGRLRPRARAAFATACALSLGIAVAAHSVLQQLPLGRADWTAAKAYTVAPATRELLRGLDVPATVRLYLSAPEKMPTAMRTLERDLRDALEELRLCSAGHLQYTVSHMDASAAMAGAGASASLEETVGRKGIRPFQVQSIDADELGVRLVYAAAAVTYKDRPEEVIPQIMPETLESFESLVMSRIYRMTLETPPTIAIVAPYAERKMDANVIHLLRQLGMNAREEMLDDQYRYLPAALEQEGYPIRRIRLTEQEPIPLETRALILVDPGELNDRQRYELNRYLVEGGALFVAAQRYQFQYTPQERGITATPNAQPVGVDGLLDGWGLGIRQEILFDAESRVLTLSAGGAGPFAAAIPVQSPIHVFVSQSQMNQSLGLTNRLPPLLYLWGSPLTVQEETLKTHGLTSTTLFTSSPRSWLVPQAEYHSFASSKPTAGPLPLAVWVRGTFPDRYAGQPVPAWPAKDAPAVETPESAPSSAKGQSPSGTVPVAAAPLTPKPGQLILTGCTEMFKQSLVTQEGHLPFFLNAVDTLVSGGTLTGIQNRRPAARALTTVSPAAKGWYRFFTLGLMPLIIIGAGLTHAAWRRRRRLRQGDAGPQPSGRRDAAAA